MEEKQEEKADRSGKHNSEWENQHDSLIRNIKPAGKFKDKVKLKHRSA